MPEKEKPTYFPIRDKVIAELGVIPFPGILKVKETPEETEKEATE